MSRPDQRIDRVLCFPNLEALTKDRLLTTGTTVDEAGFLFYSLDQACHSQLLAEAAAANGVKKNIISHEAANFTAAGIQDPVSGPLPFWYTG